MDRPNAQSLCGQPVDELEAFEVIGGEGALTASTLRWTHYSGAFPGANGFRVYVKQFGNNTDRVKRAVTDISQLTVSSRQGMADSECPRYALTFSGTIASSTAAVSSMYRIGVSTMALTMNSTKPV